MKRFRPLPLVLALAAMCATPACVMKSTHEALQNEYAETKQTLEDKNKSLSDQLDQLNEEKKGLEDQIAELQGNLAKALAEKAAIEAAKASLESEKSALEADKAALESQRAALEADKASMLSNTKQLESSIDEMKAALADLARRKAEADARIAEFKGLIARFQSLIDAGKLKVQIVDGRMVVVLSSDVLFGSGSARLSRDGKAAIAEVAALLADIPDRKFQIEGHTDNVPIHNATFPTNWELASARSITVLKTMLENGMAAERISAASFGDSKPVGDNETTEGRAMNRRIEIVVTPDLSTLPGFEELKRVSSGA